MTVDLRGSAVRRYAPPACFVRVSDILHCQFATETQRRFNGRKSERLTLPKSGVATSFRLCFVRRSTAYTSEKWCCTEKPSYVLLYNVMCVCG